MTKTVDVRCIEAILFDMNGTLRVREHHSQTQQAALGKLQQLLGKPDATDAYWEELGRRQKAYSLWAQEHLTQLSEAQIWARWMTPDLPPQQIEPIASELMLAWGERKGWTIPKPGAGETLLALRQRGYRLGLISNSMSTLDIPRSLDAFGWKEHSEAVVLSSEIKIRKPAPEPFLEACRRMEVPPAHCAYLGNRISRDMAGCKRAGFALGMILEPVDGPRSEEAGQPEKPDIVIHALTELLDIFPAR